jgi:hypothetical protein
MSAEIEAIRRRDPDLDAGDITVFTFLLLIRAVGVLAVGVVPLIVIRNGGNTDALLVPVVGSLALAIICNGTPRAQVIADILPPRSRWWAALGRLPILVAIWAFEAWRHGAS